QMAPRGSGHWPARVDQLLADGRVWQLLGNMAVCRSTGSDSWACGGLPVGVQRYLCHPPGLRPPLAAAVRREITDLAQRLPLDLMLPGWAAMALLEWREGGPRRRSAQTSGHRADCPRC